MSHRYSVCPISVFKTSPSCFSTLISRLLLQSRRTVSPVSAQLPVSLYYQALFTPLSCFTISSDIIHSLLSCGKLWKGCQENVPYRCGSQPVDLRLRDSQDHHLLPHYLHLSGFHRDTLLDHQFSWLSAKFSSSVPVIENHEVNMYTGTYDIQVRSSGNLWHQLNQVFHLIPLCRLLTKSSNALLFNWLDHLGNSFQHLSAITSVSIDCPKCFFNGEEFGSLLVLLGPVYDTHH